MPRGPRERSESGYYHVVLKGNAAQIIFETDADRYKFLDLVKKYRDELGFIILAWCLMDNHVHLIIDAGDQDLAAFMKKVEVSYVRYFNAKEERVGHLFQGRYFSKPIETDAQLLATVDYIHMNPERARMALKSEYRWSSYTEYVGIPWLTDVSLVLSMLGSVDAFKRFVGRSEDVVKASRRTVRVTDDKVLMLVRELCGDEGLEMLRGSDRRARDSVLAALARQGVPVSQIARLAGVGDNTVRRACNRGL